MIENFYSYEKNPLMTYNKLQKSSIFVGCVLKNLYDEERIKIKEDFEPKRIFHSNRFLYGALFDLDLNYKNVLNKIQSFKSIDLFTYNKIISENNLSCDENFIYFDNGLYPIDSKYIFDFLKNFKYETFFEKNSEIPLYQQIKSANLFLLMAQ